VLARSGQPVIRLTRGPDGLLLVSFRLEAADGSIVLTMDENLFMCEGADGLHDLRVDTGAAGIKVWLAHRDIGLDLEFARLRPDDLRGLLRSDRDRAEARRPSTSELAGQWALSPEEVERLLSQPPSWIDQLPPRLRRAYASEDPVAALVMDWALRRCLDDEGMIPVLSFRNLRVYDQGKTVTVRHALPPGLTYSNFLGCAKAYEL
jgi:hypothetical protein